jgi:RNA polymerase sigma factor (sigma-70 family)
MLLGATRDPELAADITQDAFLRLLNEVRAGRYPDNPGAWLYRTASNLVVSRARRTAVARRFAPRLVRHDDVPSPERIALERERSRDMERVLATLPMVERAALLMAAQGLSGEEIAAHLGKTHGAARTLLFRARTRLRRVIAERDSAR